MPNSIWDQARSLPDSQQGQPAQQPVAAQAPQQNSKPTIWDRARGLSVQNGKAPGLMYDVRDSANFLKNEVTGLLDPHNISNAIGGIGNMLSMGLGMNPQGLKDAVQHTAGQLQQANDSPDAAGIIMHGAGAIPGSPTGDMYEQYKNGQMDDLAKNIGHTAFQAVAAKAIPGASEKVGDLTKVAQESNLPGRTAAFMAKPGNLQNFSDSFAAVPTQKGIITNALDTLSRDGIAPQKNIEAMHSTIQDRLSDLSGEYEKVIPQVSNRLIDANEVLNGLSQERSKYIRNGVVSKANEPYFGKINQEIADVQQLASKRDGKLDFNDVRYMRDGANGRTDWKSPSADENLYKDLGNVYRKALDTMAPETTQLNRDWATYKNLSNISEKNLDMGRGVTESGLNKIFKPKTAMGIAGSVLGGHLGGIPGYIAGALAPEAISSGFKFAKSMPERVDAFNDYHPPSPKMHVNFQPKGLLERGPVRMGTPDASGPVPGSGPMMGRGMSPSTQKLLSAPSQTPMGGFATGTLNDLVPVKHPVTGKIEYVPAWMLQKP